MLFKKLSYTACNSANLLNMQHAPQLLVLIFEHFFNSQFTKFYSARSSI